jgi:hypothetical protein
MSTTLHTAPRPAATDATSLAPTFTKPLAIFRLGEVSAAVFVDDETSADQDPCYRISLSRRFRDEEGTWKSARTLRPSDLLAAAEALTRCWEFLREGWADRAPAA